MSKNEFIQMLSKLLPSFILALLGGGAAMADVTDGVETTGRHITGQPLETDVTREEAPDFIEDPIDAEIVKMEQSATPIDQLTRTAKARPCKGMRYEYYSIDTRAILANVESFTASSSGITGTLVVDIAGIFDPTDVIMLPEVAGWNYKTGAYDENMPLNLYVVENGTSGLTVQAVNGEPDGSGGFLIPDIEAGVQIVRLSHAASEGDVQTAPYAALPTKESQFMQIFKSQSLESSISLESQHEVRWERSEQDEYLIRCMRKEIELTYWFGQKGYFRNENTKRMVYTTEGIIPQILKSGQVLEYDADNLTEEDWIDLCKTIFSGNSGSSDRMLFCGSGFVARMAKIPSVQKRLDATSVEKVVGYTWHKIVSDFGVLHRFMHPLFDQVPGFTDIAVVIDRQYLNKYVFRSLATTQLALKEAGIYDGQSKVLTEISSICLKYGKCHAIIKPAETEDETEEDTTEDE